MTQMRKRKKESHKLTIKNTADSIFLLTCPYEELKWIQNWQYTLVYSESGKNENNCIFIETVSAQHITGCKEAEPTYWVTTRYDRENKIIHFMHARSSTIARYELEFAEIAPDETEVSLTMIITALNEEGDAIFDDSLGGRMKVMMEYLGGLLKYYCETGAMLIV